MAAMIDRILDSAVAQHRQMTADYEMVLADHFAVEGMAVVIETLAIQLARISEAVQPYLGHRDERGDLARTIQDLITPAGPSAIDLVDEFFNPDLTGTLSKSEERIYGHPDLRLVGHFAVDFETLSKTFLRHLVHTLRTGRRGARKGLRFGDSGGLRKGPRQGLKTVPGNRRPGGPCRSSRRGGNITP